MFADRLQEAIEKRGITKAKLAEKCGFDRSYITQYLRGKKEPKSVKIHQLALALDINEAWLLGYDVPMDRSLMTDSVLKEFNTLSQENQRIIVGLIHQLSGKN